jgi:hypothetical protein
MGWTGGDELLGWWDLGGLVGNEAWRKWSGKLSCVGWDGMMGYVSTGSGLSSGVMARRVMCWDGWSVQVWQEPTSGGVRRFVAIEMGCEKS